MLWSDNMVIPVGAPNPTAAEAWMNYVYDPKVQGLMEAGDPKRNITGIYYIPPVQGAATWAKKFNPPIANNPLIFPATATLNNMHIFDNAALNNETYVNQWNNLALG